MPLSDQLARRLEAMSFRNAGQDEFYAGTYPVIRQFFSQHVCCADPQPNDLKVAVILVYSWMGRAKLQPASLGNHHDAAAILARARTQAVVSPTDIQALGRLVGDSLIATSKFLHFLNPERYAIWDTNVAWAAYRFRHDEISKLAEVQQIERYLQYLRDLSLFRLPEKVERATAALIPNASAMRMKEFALFHLGIAELNAKKAEKAAEKKSKPGTTSTS